MKITAEIELSPAQVAECMQHMSDDDQAQIIIELAKLAGEWGTDPYGQWYNIGRHLRTCECTSGPAQEVVIGIHHGLTAALDDREKERMRARGLDPDFCPGLGVVS